MTTLPSFCLTVAASVVFLWTPVCRQRFKGRHGSDYLTKLLFDSGCKCSVLVDASLSAEV